MIMNNMESDTEEVFYGGKTYKKVSNELKHGLGRKKPSAKKPDPFGIGDIEVADYQQMLHNKAKLAQDNTDEPEEPGKPDYDIFQIVEE